MRDPVFILAASSANPNYISPPRRPTSAQHSATFLVAPVRSPPSILGGITRAHNQFLTRSLASNQILEEQSTTPEADDVIQYFCYLRKRSFASDRIFEEQSITLEDDDLIPPLCYHRILIPSIEQDDFKHDTRFGLISRPLSHLGRRLVKKVGKVSQTPIFNKYPPWFHVKSDNRKQIVNFDNTPDPENDPLWPAVLDTWRARSKFMKEVLLQLQSQPNAMEALSIRPVNLQYTPRTTTKEEILKSQEAAARKAEKEKKLAPAPPKFVIQPVGPDGIDSEKFQTGACLGKGGFAICHEATLVGLKYKGEQRNRKFALKIVRSKLGSKKVEDKFKSELQIHSKMRHPNIVEFHRAFTFNTCMYVVLELCPNGSIMDMVKQRGCLSLPEVRRFTIQLCGAIKYMHGRNIIHRDLKMGNIFLDQNLNIKIGDFGLAAILWTKDEAKEVDRRKTICGTPNYIAPEILDKRPNGHDHKVDIWAIGVIIYAMSNGYPPFQSPSPDEIYQKVKVALYDWPKNDKFTSPSYSWTKDSKCSNETPDELKALVSTLLRVRAEERPDPDMIVQHAFFSMHGGIAIPLSLDKECVHYKPSWLEKSRPYGDVMSLEHPHTSAVSFSKECGLGDGLKDLVGEDLNISVYRACVAEEKRKCTPVVPLPEGTVYSSYPVSHTWPTVIRAKAGHLSIASIGSMSHAAQLRAQSCIGNAPTRPKARTRAQVDDVGPNPDRFSVVSRDTIDDLQIAGIPDMETASTSSRGTVTDTEAQHLIPKPSQAELKPPQVEPKPPQAEPKPSQAESEPPRVKPTLSRVTRSVATRALNKALPAVKEAARRQAMKHEESTLAAAVAMEMAGAANIKKDLVSGSLPLLARKERLYHIVKPKFLDQSTQPLSFLIGQDESAQSLPGTKPEEVKKNLSSLQSNLSSILEKESVDLQASGSMKHPIPDAQHAFTAHFLGKDPNPQRRPVVVKWVDYTNKFGIGYVLANGTVGCAFKSMEGNPPVCVVVPGAEQHLKNRKYTAYTERHQIVPKDGAAIEFFENCGNEGIKRVLVSPEEYQIEDKPGRKVKPDEKVEALKPDINKHDAAKRNTLNLWSKFAKYMTQASGNKEDSASSLGSVDKQDNTDHVDPDETSIFVKFYQRLGNVGIWGFGDGSFQFNFPDHTKLVLSNDGLYLDFYHLSANSAKTLRDSGALETWALDDRSVLSYPTDTFVNILSKKAGRRLREILDMNELVPKLSWIFDVVVDWNECGGLGCLDQPRKYTWEGLRDGGPQKLVWVSIGACGGDKHGWYCETRDED